MKITTPVRAVLFDFDGTLGEVHIDFDLMRRRVGAIASWFLEHVPASREPVLEWMDHLAGLIGRKLGRDKALEFHARARLAVMAQELDAAGEGRLFPGVLPALQILKETKIHMGIVTRNTTAAVRTVFPDYVRYDMVLVARDEARRIKPHPDHLLQVLERLQVRPEHAFMAGDHPLDMEAGQRAGMRTAGLFGFNNNRRELEAAGADFLFSHCPEFIEHLVRNIQADPS